MGAVLFAVSEVSGGCALRYKVLITTQKMKAHVETKVHRCPNGQQQRADDALVLHRQPVAGLHVKPLHKVSRHRQNTVTLKD